MKSYKIRTLQIILLISLYINASSKPILNETYEANSRVRSGIAIGGIGTGSIELRKDGNFYNWTIFNNYPLSTGRFFSIAELPGKNSDKSLLFFLVRYQVEGQAPKLKLLQLNNSLQEGGLEGIAYYYPWMSGIEKIQYSARFPFSNLVFTDSEMPFDIEMEAFSPFIPHDVKNSSLPGAYFNFKITSRTTKKVDVMIVGSLRNLVGYDLIRKAFSSELVNEPDYKFFIHSASGMDETHDTFGQMGLGALGGNEVSYYLGWEHKHPYYEKLLIENRLANIDDTENRNYQLENITLGRMGSTDNDQRCFSSIAVSKILDAYNSVNCTFFMNWHFPNQYGAIQGKMNGTPSLSEREKQNFTVNLERTKFIGKYYSNYFSDIKSLADYFVANETDLKNRSKSFIEDMYTSDIEPFVLDQINSHMNTFITSSTLTKNGQYAIREGLTTAQAWGPNSTSDVLLYASPMIIALFPDLQKSMMRTHAKLQTLDGEINHGLGFDPDYNQNGTWGVYERVDLVPNYIQMVLRDYLFTNDINYMKEMWPTIVKGINYILTKRDTNGDMMPDMHGIMCSYDNFPMYGLASYIQSQWIAALRMASIVAVDMGDKTLAKKYANIAKKGSELMDQKLWNGSYYNLSNDYTGNKGIDNGCLTDQLIGQWVAHNAGIGYLFDRQKVQKTLQSIMQKSFMHNSFLRNCSWPATPELFPIHTSDLWVDQANTPWTGVELAFASFLIYENRFCEALKVIKAVDQRYRKAGLYFDHQEFGGHYLRPMSAWSILNAYLGFSTNRGNLTFRPGIESDTFRLFFVTADATAIYSNHPDKISIEIRTGELKFRSIKVEKYTGNNRSPMLYINNNKIKNQVVEKTGDTIQISFNQIITVEKGSLIELK